MRRSLIALSFFVAVLAPASVRADHCLVSAYAWELRESVEHGPFFSSDGAGLTSTPRRTILPAPHPIDGLVCVSSDDPRCMPRDGAPDGPSFITLSASHAAATLPSTRVDEAPRGSIRWQGVLLTGARGVCSRVDRPPRA